MRKHSNLQLLNDNVMLHWQYRIEFILFDRGFARNIQFMNADSPSIANLNMLACTGFFCFLFCFGKINNGIEKKIINCMLDRWYAWLVIKTVIESLLLNLIIQNNSYNIYYILMSIRSICKRSVLSLKKTNIHSLHKA